MGTKHPKKKKVEDMTWEEYQEWSKNINPKKDIEEYRNYRKNLIFIEGDTINVNVKQKFAYETSDNYSINPRYCDQSSTSEPDKLPKEIEKIERRSFYPYELGYCGGNTYFIQVYKATKKGTYKMRIDSKEINVIVK